MTAAGIRSYGCYVPRGRLGRAAIAAAWGRPAAGAPGERAVALYDEDALTMAVEAASEALAGLEPNSVGGVYLATTSSPFAEKSAADVVSAALDLRAEVATADFTGSTRAFGAALRAACDAVLAGSARNVLVVATDLRLAEPGSAAEPLLGDAAAAVVVSSEESLAEIEQHVSLGDDFAPVWRRSGDRFVSADDDKVATLAYVAALLRTARRTLEQVARDPADLALILAHAPDPGAYRALVKASGFGEKFLADPLLGAVGDAGAANLALQLCGALGELEEGQRLLCLDWGGTADGLLLRGTAAAGTPGDAQTPALPGARRARSLGAWLASKTMLSYHDYLRHRDLLASRGGIWTFDPVSSLTADRREARQILRLRGARCESCGALLYPVRPACRRCGASGPFVETRLGRRGAVVTWTRDHVYPGPGSPVANVAVDLEGGGRLLTQMAEGEPAIGMAVELTLRKLHEGRGLPHYWWKAREPRGVALEPPGGPVAQEALS